MNPFCDEDAIEEPKRTPVELKLWRRFFRLAQEYSAAASASGARLSAGEEAQLNALERPSAFRLA